MVAVGHVGSAGAKMPVSLVLTCRTWLLKQRQGKTEAEVYAAGHALIATARYNSESPWYGFLERKWKTAREFRPLATRAPEAADDDASS